MVVTSDIAKSYMDVLDNRILATARTQYKNIVETLNGTLVTGNEHGYFIKGKVVVAATTPDMMEQYIEDDDMVILGDLQKRKTVCLSAHHMTHLPWRV